MIISYFHIIITIYFNNSILQNFNIIIFASCEKIPKYIWLVCLFVCTKVQLATQKF